MMIQYVNEKKLCKIKKNEIKSNKNRYFEFLNILFLFSCTFSKFLPVLVFSNKSPSQTREVTREKNTSL